MLILLEPNAKKIKEEDGPTNGNPPIMDLFTIKATIPGFISWRNPSNGKNKYISWKPTLKIVYNDEIHI